MGEYIVSVSRHIEKQKTTLTIEADHHEEAEEKAYAEVSSADFPPQPTYRYEVEWVDEG